MTSTETAAQPDSLSRILQTHGDTLFDLCERVLWNESNAHHAFRTVLKDIKNKAPANPYSSYETAWIFRLASDRLTSMSRQYGRQLTSAEQVMLDSTPDLKERLNQLEYYLHRLPVQDQLILLFIDRYQLSYADAASALNLPEDSLRLRRFQVIRMLEEWIWNLEWDGASPMEDYTVDPQSPERRARVEKILNRLRNLPKSSLPVPIRKAPLSSPLPRIETTDHRSRWERLPWFVRTGLEGLGVAFAILSMVALVPKIRTLYEQSLEKRLDHMILADSAIDTDEIDASLPLARGKQPGGTPSEAAHDEFAGENEADFEEDPPAEVTTVSDVRDVRVGNSEIWRFSIRTDSPREIRSKVVQALKEVRIPEDTPGFGGIEAPGGIQFDLLIPKSAVAQLKQSLQKIGSSSRNLQGISSSSSTGAFTWYKNKSRRAIPHGKARVVIWLSQM